MSCKVYALNCNNNIQCITVYCIGIIHRRIVFCICGEFDETSHGFDHKLILLFCFVVFCAIPNQTHVMCLSTKYQYNHDIIFYKI